MNGGPRPQRFELRQLARGFDWAAPNYDRCARLQAEVRDSLLGRLEFLRLEVRRVLDLGSGSVSPLHCLRRRYSGVEVLAVDISQGMLSAMRPRRFFPDRRFNRFRADAHHLPFAAGCMDLVFSNLMLQWCGDLGQALTEVRRVLRPGGAFLFSTLGPDTLKELRWSWARVDDSVHVHDFLDMHQVGDMLGLAGLSEAVLDVDMRVRHFPDCYALMRDLKAVGASNKAPGRSGALGGRDKMRRMIEAYEQFRGERGLPASYEVIYGLAWRSSSAAPAEQGIPLQSVRDALVRR